MALCLQCVRFNLHLSLEPLTYLAPLPRELGKLDVQSPSLQVHKSVCRCLLRCRHEHFSRPRHPRHAYSHALEVEYAVAQEGELGRYVFGRVFRNSLQFTSPPFSPTIEGLERPIL